jgi:tetratricopeptide (TPR) repeat protein
MTKHRAPTIFLSSVIRGVSKSLPALALHREEIYDLVVNHFGWECLCSGVDDGAFWGGPLSACIQGVERCDLFLGILWHQSGSIIDYHRISVTEHEIYTALNHQKALRLYIVDAEKRDPALQALIDVLSRDIELGVYIRRCGIADLRETVREDLESFRKNRLAGIDNSEMSRKLYLHKYLRGLAHSPAPFPLTYNVGAADTWDPDRLLTLLNEMDRFHAVQDHVAILNAGCHALPILQARSPVQFPKVRPLWTHFLGRWYGACNWLGRLEGHFGSLAAGRAAMEIARLSEDFLSFHEWAAILGSTLYTLGTLVAAGERLPGRAPSGVSGRRESELILNNALAYNSLSFYRRPAPDINLLSSRASLLFHLKDNDTALSLFQTCLHRVGTHSEYSRTLGMIGRIQLRKGRRKAADRCLEDSIQGSFIGDPGAQVRCGRNYAEALIAQGRIQEGLAFLQEVLRDANRYGFVHQARVCEGVVATTSRML